MKKVLPTAEDWNRPFDSLHGKSVFAKRVPVDESVCRVRSKAGEIAVYVPNEFADAVRNFFLNKGIRLRPPNPTPYTLTDKFRAHVACTRIDVASSEPAEQVEALLREFMAASQSDDTDPGQVA